MVKGVQRARFLGLDEEQEGPVDIAILSLPYELTTSFGEGTDLGPAACIVASAQVELYDPVLAEDLPANCNLHTAEPWDGTGDSLLQQLDSMVDHLRPWFIGDCFPLVLGGEHGILPSVVRAAADHPELGGQLSKLTIVQVDAHADLREELDGERWSHACAAARALDLGIGELLQVGVRTFCMEEARVIEQDERIHTWFARDLLGPSGDAAAWESWLDALRELEGPVHLTVDIDGLDGSLVPATGTPVPGGLQFWHLVESIEALFDNPAAIVISADVNEIVPGENDPLTQFTAAMIVKQIIVSHIGARRAGRWRANAQSAGRQRTVGLKSEFFSRGG